jgi:hypothetical protein
MMWGLLNRPRRKSKSAPKRTFRPILEALEARNCPSPVITSFSANPTNGPGSRQVELKGTVSDFNPQMDTVTFTGQVGGQTTPDFNGNFDYVGSAGGLGTVTAVATTYITSYMGPMKISSAPVTATITDAWQAMGLNASCDGSGNFKATFFLPTLTSGSVTAQCMDVWGLLSNTVIDPIV